MSKLFSSVAVLSLAMAGAMAPVATASPVPHQIMDVCVDSGVGFIASNGVHLVVDLSLTPGGADSVIVDSEAAMGCIDTLQTVTFLGGPVTDLTIDADAFNAAVEFDASSLTEVTFPSGLKTLTIGDHAFFQYSTTTPNTLKTVTFPDSLKNLVVDSFAFAQESFLNSNALDTVIFPAGLENLTIEDYAFYQDAGASNTLKSVTFPDRMSALTISTHAFAQYAVLDNALELVAFPTSLISLNIGVQAFQQWANRSNALQTVNFPDGLNTLEIEDYAFEQDSLDGANSLQSVSFPSGLAVLRIGDFGFHRSMTTGPAKVPISLIFRTAVAPGSGSGTVHLGNEITDPESHWFWYGSPATTTAAWALTITVDSLPHFLSGYQKIDFYLKEGAFADPITSAYVYTSGAGGVPSWGFEPGFTGVDPVIGGAYLLEPPAATKTGYTFKGWCEMDLACSKPLTAGSVNTVKKNTHTLYAKWEVLPTVPGSPKINSATPKSGQVTLNWSPPGSNGGSRVTGYEIQYRASGTTEWSTLSTSGWTSTVTGLTNGTAYQFQVAATNALGTGTFSTLASATPAGAPDIPLNFECKAEDGRIALSWGPPTTDGGSPVIEYFLGAFIDGNDAVPYYILPADGRSFLAPLRADNRKIHFHLKATNEFGSSGYAKCLYTPAVVEPLSEPGIPIGVSTEPGHDEATVSWSAPATDGGSAITDYKVEYRPVGGTSWTSINVTADSDSIIIGGLSNGTTYEFRVAATNDVGTGDFSPTQTVTPIPRTTIPGVPIEITTLAGDGQVVFSWRAPVADGGSVVTGYLAQYRAVGATAWTSVPTFGLTSAVTGLINGTGYEFKVAAINAIGTGAFTVPVSVVVPVPVVTELVVTRVSGADRFLTSLDLNDDRMVTGAPVFVATGVSFPDALSAGPAVKSVKGSLVLTPKTLMPKAMVDLIKAKKPSVIYVIGGAGSVSEAVYQQLTNIGTVKRVAGSDRYSTSNAIFNQFFKGKTLDGAFIATGLSYPDDLSAAAAGGALNRPVLLVDNGKGISLDPATVAALKVQGVKKVQVVGGTSTVSAAIGKQLVTSGFTVQRLAGTDRYGTNLVINNMLNTELGDSPTGLWVAAGKNFPDALSGAVPAGDTAERLVLSNGTCLPKPIVTEWIKGKDSKITHVTLIGGEASLAKPVYDLTECK